MTVTKAQQRAVTKYIKENYDEFKVRLPRGTKAKIKAAAEDQEPPISVNAWISQAIKEKMERDNDGS